MISLGVNFSTTFQVAFIDRNNFFYGNCVDLTAVALAFYKALGIPALHLCYGVIAEGYFREVHSFPVYYSSREDGWFNYLRGGNEPPGWYLKEGATLDVFFYVNGLHAGSHWESKNRSYRLS